jgi:hypothetical protein
MPSLDFRAWHVPASCGATMLLPLSGREETIRSLKQSSLTDPQRTLCEVEDLG